MSNVLFIVIQNGYEIENSFDWRRSVTGQLTFSLQL